MPLTPADKRMVVSALATIARGGLTNLHGSRRAGADELAGKLADAFMRRKNEQGKGRRDPDARS